MNYQNIYVNGNRMEPNRIYAGTRGSYITDVSFSFSGEWEGLTKKLIFYPVRGTPVYTVYTHGTVRIPARVMRNAGISVMLISGYTVTKDGKIGKKIITASASVLVESADSDTRNEPDIPDATAFEEIVAKLGAPYIGESGNWYIWDVDTHEFVDTGLPARGEKGETGRGLTILGKYGSLEELRASVKDAQPGDAYAVGEKAPYTIYIWDEKAGDFTDHGDMRGVGITKIEQITDNTGSGEPNTIRIYTDDGVEYDYTVYNGERGHPGNIWIGETEPPDDSYVIWLNPRGAVSGFVASYQGTANAGRVLVVGEDGTVVPGEAKGNVELDTTLTQSGKAADAKAVGDRITEQGKTIPKVFKWANADLPFTEDEISGVLSGGGFVVNPTNFADGKTYFLYHAGASYGFRWTNPNPQKGSLTITMRGYSQYSNILNTKIVTVYTDGTDNSLTDMMYLPHGETVTYTTDPDKTVDYIRGNYDFENWVLLDMDVLSIVADYPAPTGTVKTVNGVEPDGDGNVEIEIPEGGGGSGGSGGGEWTKLGDITVSDTFEFNPISFTGGVVTLDTNADGYSFMNKNQVIVVFHPIDVKSNINPYMYKLKPKDYAAGTFDVFNLDGQAQTSASMDITKYKMSVPNIGLVEMNDIPYYDRYKVRFTFPTMCTHGIRRVFGGNVGSLYFDACFDFCRSGGVIMEHELFTSPYDPNYMVRRSTVVFGNFYGMGEGATWEAVTIVQSGDGKTHPVNGVVNFQSGSCPFVNGSRFELWGANDV